MSPVLLHTSPSQSMRRSASVPLANPIIYESRKLSFQTAKDGFVERLQDVGALRWQQEDLNRL